MLPATADPETPMDAVRAQRCRLHPAREAAARCPGCGGCFCRECVTEHAGRLLCAACLARAADTARPVRRRFRGFAALAGFLALWGALYLSGRLLLAIPSDTHDLESADGHPTPETPEP